MLRSVLKILGLTAMLVAASMGVLHYQQASSASKQIEQLQDEKRQIQEVVTRLSEENRVADILVSHQDIDAKGIKHTTLLFVEYDKQGNALPARSFTIEGDNAHIDALIIKFERGFIADNDALRGHSIALFTRIYGDHQSPADALMIDSPGRIPDIYKGTDPRVSEFETSLWKDFWRLYDDKAYREARGVRALGGHGLWGPFLPQRLYTITLESAGGMSMTSEPLKGIYREALKQQFPTTAPSVH